MKSKCFRNDWKCSGFHNNVAENLQPVSLVKKNSSKSVVLRLRIPEKAFEKHFLKYHENNSRRYVIIMSRMRFRVNLHSSYLNVKELFARDRRDIWSLSVSNRIRTQNPLIHKWKLYHLAKMAKWLSCAVSTYLYVAFDCMLLSCHVHVLE